MRTIGNALLLWGLGIITLMYLLGALGAIAVVLVSAIPAVIVGAVLGE